MHLGVAPAGFDSLTLAGLARHARAFRLGSAGNFWIWQVHASSRQILNINWCFYSSPWCFGLLEHVGTSPETGPWMISKHVHKWPQVALHGTSNCGEEKGCHGTMFKELQIITFVVSLKDEVFDIVWCWIGCWPSFYFELIANHKHAI